MKKTNRLVSLVISLALILSSTVIFGLTVSASEEDTNYKNIVYDMKELYDGDKSDFNNNVKRLVNAQYATDDVAAIYEGTSYQDGCTDYYLANTDLKLIADPGYYISEVRITLSETAKDFAAYEICIFDGKAQYNLLTSKKGTENDVHNGLHSYKTIEYVVTDIPAGVNNLRLTWSHNGVGVAYLAAATRIEFTEQKMSYDVTVESGKNDKIIHTISNMNNWGYFQPVNTDGSSYIIFDTRAIGVIPPEMFYFLRCGSNTTFLKIYTGSDVNALSLVETNELIAMDTTEKVNTKTAKRYSLPLELNDRYVKLEFGLKDWNNLVGNYGLIYPSAVSGQKNNADGTVTYNFNQKIMNWGLENPAVVNSVESSDGMMDSANITYINENVKNVTVQPVNGKRNRMYVWDFADLTPLCPALEVK